MPTCLAILPVPRPYVEFLYHVASLVLSNRRDVCGRGQVGAEIFAHSFPNKRMRLKTRFIQYLSFGFLCGFHIFVLFSSLFYFTRMLSNAGSMLYNTESRQ